ncbi:Uncharacterised protein [Shigella sonnei]|nr:Uncharacterised protein [Shigella sonnei]CSR63467.1 Uncharacterised protein [Shigella sonnei]
MYHHHRVFRHNDVIATHGNKRGHRSRHAFNVYNFLCRMIFQGVIDSQPFKDVATR